MPNPAGQVGSITCTKHDNPNIVGPLTLPGVNVKTGSNLWVPFGAGNVPTIGGRDVVAVSLLSVTTVYKDGAPFILVGATVTLDTGHTGLVTAAASAGAHVTIS